MSFVFGHVRLLFLALALLSIAVSTAKSIPKHQQAPPLERMSRIQQQVLANATRQALENVATGRAKLLALFEANQTRKYMKQLLPAGETYLADLSASTQLELLVKGLESSELVHNFGSESEGNCGLDVTLYSGTTAPYFFNQWMLQVLRYVPIDAANNIYTEASETTYFGFPP